MRQRAAILHILTDLDRGGAQKVVSDLCVAMKQRGLDIHLAYSSLGVKGPDSANTLRQYLTLNGVPLHDISPMRHSINPFLDIVGFFRLVALLVRLKPVIVHTHMAKAGVLGRLAAALTGVTHVIHSVHGWSFYSARNVPTEKIFVGLERLAAARTRHMLAVSHAAVRDGIERGIGRPTTYSVVRAGVDLGAFRSHTVPREETLAQLQLSEDVQVVGTVGRLARPKAPMDFLAVVEKVVESHPSCKFLMVGDGPLYDDIAKEIVDRGLSDCVFLLGPRDDVAALMQCMDVYLLTSHWEGLSLSVIEALAAGIPVVATDVGGHSEVVLPGINGFLARAGDIGALAAAVDELLTAPMARTDGWQELLDEFDRSFVVEQHLRLCHALLREDR